MPIALLTLLVAALALGFGVHLFGKVRGERLWPTVPGRILERGVGAAMQSQGRSFLPHAKYTYSVGGREFTNDQVYLIRGTGGSRQTIQNLVDGLPDPVPVHYDPQDPSRSFLIVNPMSTIWLTLGVGVLALVLGLGQLVVVLFPAP